MRCCSNCGSPNISSASSGLSYYCNACCFYKAFKVVCSNSISGYEKKKELPAIQLESTYRVKKGRLGGRELKPDRVSKCGSYGFFNWPRSDSNPRECIRVHTKHLTKILNETPTARHETDSDIGGTFSLDNRHCPKCKKTTQQKCYAYWFCRECGIYPRSYEPKKELNEPIVPNKTIQRLLKPVSAKPKVETIERIKSAEHESMKELHTVAYANISANNRKRIETLKRDLKEQGEVAIAEVEAIREATGQNKPSQLAGMIVVAISAAISSAMLTAVVSYLLLS